MNKVRVALVHDWLIHMRGGERVLEVFAEIFPEATIYTLFTRREKLSPALQRMKIQTSALQYFPGITKYYRWLLPILPFFIRSLRIEDAGLVISLSHCVAKGVLIPKGAKHFCYCLTPMRYLWGFEEVYFGRLMKWFPFIVNPILNWLRKWDVATSQGVDAFFCISEVVKKRIEKNYGREATVIYPPVDAQFFRLDSIPKRKDDYYLVVSAFTPYKRVDLAIEACNRLGRKLLIAGEGPLLGRYQEIARENIHFVGPVPDSELVNLYHHAKAIIFPQEEDFGIVPLEAQACGTPVIALAKGGVLETVKEGVFFHDQTTEAVSQAVLEFESKNFDPFALREQALRFDKPLFKTRIKQAIENALS
ncbi:MAG: glycosyltransferase [Candidatus Omnitrophica bacterium]|nr:glycosyltransferase [Candidatus Omnitrophota bacterium]